MTLEFGFGAFIKQATRGIFTRLYGALLDMASNMLRKPNEQSMDKASQP